LALFGLPAVPLATALLPCVLLVPLLTDAMVPLPF